ncbi:MAG: hypothetical protein QW594_03000, partial [Candidatus Woesearchaeota archaeon]
MEKEGDLVHTDVDLLLELVSQRKEISVEEAAAALNLPIKTVESLADYLDEEGLLTIQYKLTTEYLVYIDREENQKQLRRSEEHLESLFAALKEDFSKGLRYISDGDFSQAHLFYKKINNDIKQIHKELKLDSKKFPHLDTLNFIVRLENIEHLLDHVNNLIEKNEEQRVIAAFNRIDQEIKSVFQDLHTLYHAATASHSQEGKTATDSQRPDFRKELQKKLEETRAYNQEPTQPPAAGTQRLTEAGDLQGALATLQTISGEPLAFDRYFEQAAELLAQGKPEEAKRLYEQLQESVSSYTHAYATRRLELKKKLLELHQQLEAHQAEQVLVLLEKKKKEADELFTAFTTAYQQKDLQAAKQYFNLINTLFKELPDDLLTLRVELETRIITAHDQLLMLEQEIYNAALAEHTEQINTLLEQGKTALEANNLSHAVQCYHQAKEHYQQIPDGYLNEKVALQEKIFSYYKMLMQVYKEDSHFVFTRLSHQILILCDEFDALLQQRNLEKAAPLLISIEEHFKMLPEGFLAEQNKLEKAKVKIILDSNALFVPLQFKIDIFEELRGLLKANIEPILLSSVRQELEKLTKYGTPSMRKKAAYALQLAEKCRLIKTDENFASPDDAIFKCASKWKTPVFTNDRTLRKKLRNISVPVIYV